MSTPYPISYLDVVTGTTAAQIYKRRTYEATGAKPGHEILDVGCGTGDDVRLLERLVAPAGRVVGVDLNPQMIAEAWRRIGGSARAAFSVGDAHALKFPDASFDAVRCDRALQHMERPAQVVAELQRVVRPGGVVVIAEPDWDTLVVDCSDRVTTRRIIHHLTDTGVRHGWIGRQLPRLYADAGLERIEVSAFPFLLRDLATAEAICGLARHAAAAVGAGVVTQSEVDAWQKELEALNARGIFCCGVLGFMAVGARAHN